MNSLWIMIFVIISILVYWNDYQGNIILMNIWSATGVISVILWRIEKKLKEMKT